MPAPRNGRKGDKRGFPRRLPGQEQLQVITSALHAALEYSPLAAAPLDQDAVFSYVSRQIEERFWRDIYVERPEVGEILQALETGRLVLISGERGCGKSTTVRAVVNELVAKSPRRGSSLVLDCVFDANQFAEDLRDVARVSETVQLEIYRMLRQQIGDEGPWLAYLYETHAAFEGFRQKLRHDGFREVSGEDLWELATDQEYEEEIEAGRAAFLGGLSSDQLRSLLQFIGERTEFEPLVVVDNIDHLANDAANRCGEVLSAVIQSSHHRVRGAIAVRPENADAIQYILDTAAQPQRVSLMPRGELRGRREDASISLALRFIENRVAILREPETVAVIVAAIDQEKTSQLAKRLKLGEVGDFLDLVLELIDVLIYDVFRSEETNQELRRENTDFAHALYCWHNGSLRECGLSLTTFASDILLGQTGMYELQDLLISAVERRGEDSLGRRFRMRRLARSLLYRHLLFWTAPEDNGDQPLRNVMVFDGNEETTDPPLHFLRLRLLQYLAQRQRKRATVGGIRGDFGKLGVEQTRLDEALRELAVKRSENDAGLIRIDNLTDEAYENLHGESFVQLLDAGAFLVESLYTKTEYLFWSAVNSKAKLSGVPAAPDPVEIQDDAFRTTVATRFLEEYLVQKFREEHPYLNPGAGWSTIDARGRLVVYQRLFGFQASDWFLNRVTTSISKFIPRRDPDGRYAEPKERIKRIRALADTLDQLAVAARE